MHHAAPVRRARSLLLPLLSLAVALSALILRVTDDRPAPNPPASNQPSASTAPNSASTAEDPAATVEKPLREPIAGFATRITKKPFGRYVSPANSPVQPERFTGYHTGADVEYEDVAVEVPVYAVAAGTVVYSGFVDGYGGVIILRFIHQNQTYTALYGHLKPSRLPPLEQPVGQGEELGVLGTGYSQETDGERRHLHFSVRPDSAQDLRGYVPTETELAEWLNPADFLSRPD